MADGYLIAAAVNALPALLDTLTDQAERLAVAREALRDLLGWGVHDEGCDLHPEYGKVGRRIKCTCGLKEAEEAARAAIERIAGGRDG